MLVLVELGEITLFSELLLYIIKQRELSDYKVMHTQSLSFTNPQLVMQTGCPNAYNHYNICIS